MTLAHPTPILSTTRGAPPCHINTTTSLLPSRKRACMLVFEAGSFLPPPPFSLENKRTLDLCHHHHRKRAYALVFETGCSLLPPPFSLENKRIRLFFRAVVLCHHHHPPPSKTSVYARFRDQLLFATSKMSTYTHFRRCLIFLMYIILSIIYFSILSGFEQVNPIVPFVQVVD